MITKNYPTVLEFAGWMEKLKKISDDNDKAAEGLENIIESHVCINGWSEDLIVRLLERLMNDKFSYISWWIYDKEWGTDKKMKVYIDKMEIKTKTVEDLYNLLQTYGQIKNNKTNGA